SQGDREGAVAQLAAIRKLNEPVPEKEKKTGGYTYLNSPLGLVVQADLEARLGDFDAAMKTADGLTEPHDKVEVLCAIAAQLLNAKRKDDGRALLLKAGKIAEEMSNHPKAMTKLFPAGATVGVSHNDRSQMLRRIAELQAKSGDAEGALKTVSQ